jgi:hypothetical protein
VDEFRYEVRERFVAAGYGCQASSAAQFHEALLLCRDIQSRTKLIDEMMRVGRKLAVLNPNAATAAAKCMANEETQL